MTIRLPYCGRKVLQLYAILPAMKDQGFHLGRKIAVILFLKIMAIMILYFLFFSRPLHPTLEALTQHFFGR